MIHRYDCETATMHPFNFPFSPFSRRKLVTAQTLEHFHNDLEMQVVRSQTKCVKNLLKIRHLAVAKIVGNASIKVLRRARKLTERLEGNQ